MNISDAGLDIIKEFEGYKDGLPDGSCRAYRCVVGHRNGAPVYDGKWTIGWGCTKNVTQGMVWSKKQAEAGLREEISHCEANVTRCVTVELNQNEFDALTSFDYNCGDGALASSTLIKLLNRGDRAGAAAQFALWTSSNGVHNVPGLVRRRREEAALFLKPVISTAPDGIPVSHDMPQTIDPPSSAEQHASVHDYLEKGSTYYEAHGELVHKGGMALLPTLVAVWNWATNPLHACLLVTGAALAVGLVLELSRLHQRNQLVGGGK